MKNLTISSVVLLVVLAGCSGAGDTPVNTYKVDAKANTKPAGPNQGFGSAVQGNPNMPEAAKNALLGQGGSKQ